MKYFKTTLITASLLALTACGGGGSDDKGGNNNGNDTSATTLTLGELSTFSYNEKTAHTWALNVNYDGNASDLTYSVNETTNSNFVTVSAGGGKVELTLGDMLEGLSKTVSFTVTVTDGKLTDTVSVSGDVVNTSLQETTSTAKALADKADTFSSNGIDELNWYGVYSADLQYLSLDIDADAKVNLKNTFSDAVTQIKSTASNVSAALNEALANTSVALVDSKLSAVLQTQSDNFNALPSMIQSALVDLDDKNNAYTLPTITSLNNGSVFYGNLALGSVSNSGTFVFNDAYSFLDIVVSGSNFGCNAQ